MNNIIAFPSKNDRFVHLIENLSPDVNYKLTQVILYALNHINTESCNIRIFSKIPRSSIKTISTKFSSINNRSQPTHPYCNYPFNKVYEKIIAINNSTLNHLDENLNESNRDRCSYLCYPIESEQNSVIGTFYLFDNNARKYSESEKFIFALLGTMVESILQGMNIYK